MAIYIMNKKLLNVSSEIYAFESSVPALQNNITALRSNCGMYIHGLTTWIASSCFNMCCFIVLMHRSTVIDGVPDLTHFSLLVSVWLVSGYQFCSQLKWGWISFFSSSGTYVVIMWVGRDRETCIPGYLNLDRQLEHKMSGFFISLITNFP